MSNNTIPEIVNNPVTVDYANPYNTPVSFSGALVTANMPTPNVIIVPEEKPNDEVYIPTNQPVTPITPVENKPNVPDKANEFNNTLNNVSESPKVNPEVYNTAFNFLKENGLFLLPDNVEITEKNFQDIIDYNKQLNIQEAYNEIRSLAGDESVAQLFDLVVNGGTFDDLQLGKEIVSEENEILNLDVTIPEHQKILITAYYKDGLDPNKPSHKERLDNVNTEVNAAIDSYKGEEIAKKAKDYFLKDIAREKAELQTQIEQRQIEERKQVELQKQQEELWRKNFVGALNKRDWSTEKRNDVINQFDTLEFTNGTEMPLWKYKLQMIQSNPEQTHLLMDFLADYDHTKREFKSKNISVEKKATDMIKNLIINQKTTHNNGIAGNNITGTGVEYAIPKFG